MIIQHENALFVDTKTPKTIIWYHKHYLYGSLYADYTYECN